MPEQYTGHPDEAAIRHKEEREQLEKQKLHRSENGDTCDDCGGRIYETNEVVACDTCGRQEQL